MITQHDVNTHTLKLSLVLILQKWCYTLFFTSSNLAETLGKNLADINVIPRNLIFIQYQQFYLAHRTTITHL